MALTLLHRPAIPRPATSLVGREDELARVLAMLADPSVRLVTLTGPGGVGKTRLALQVGHDADPDAVGEVFFIGIASATAGDAALTAIVSTLGIGQVESIPTEQRLIDAIGDRRLLLILDNAEQVADQLTPLANILAHCRNLTILVTSRVMLRLSAEVVFPIEPLATTSAAASGIAPAAMLFIDRARAVRPDLSLSQADIAAIDEICRDLDGLPLAIELAAARARFLSPAALRARLGERLRVLTGGPRDAPARHQTLRATLEWSHDLLGPAERTLFRRLAIFENGAPYDAVAPVCGDGLDADVDETLAALADHSLVRIFDRPETGPRVRLLNTIREFAREQLDASGEIEAIADAHARWFAGLVMATPTTAWRTGTPELRESTMRFMPDVDNFAAMLPRQLDSGRDADTALVVTGLVSLWIELGQLRDARVWVQRVTPFIDAVPERDRIHVHYMVASVAFASDVADDAREHGEKALALAMANDDSRMVANSQNLLGQIAWHRGDPAEGERMQRAAIATSRATATGEDGVALFSSMLALRLAERGALDEAETLLEDALPIIERERPDASHLMLGGMGYLRLLQGEPDRAAPFLEASLAFHRESPYRQQVSLVERLAHVSWLAALWQLEREAARLFSATEALCDRIGLPVEAVCVVGAAAVRRFLQERLEPDVLIAERAAGRSLSASEAVALALEIAQVRPEPGPGTAVTEPARDTMGLTERQLDVLRLLAEGKSNPAIAEALFISERTVTTHLTRIYDRLDVTTRTEAVARATQLGLVGTAVSRDSRT